MEFVVLFLVAVTVKKVLDAVKYTANYDWSALVTQVLSWAGGIGSMAVLAHTALGDKITMFNELLALLNGWTQAVLGVGAASAASVGWDFIKAFDNTNSAAVPSLDRRRTPHDPSPKA
jgi:hypothetical protein